MNLVKPDIKRNCLVARRISKPPYSVCVVGVFKDDSCSNVHLAKGLESCSSVSRIMRFDYRECQNTGSSKLVKSMNRIPQSCNLIIICKGSGIQPNIIKTLSSRATVYLWFMDWYPQIEWNKPILQYSRFCHYRSATGFDTAILWADKIKLPVYHVLDAAAPYLYYPEKVEKQYDVSFIGSSDTEREVLYKYLKSKGFNVGFFGPGFTSLVDPVQFRNICSKSKVVLNVSRSSYAGYSSLRLWNLLSCGSMVLTKEIPGIEEHLKLVPGKTIDQFSSLVDLEKKLKYYLSNNREREIIAKSALEYVSSNRTWKHTAEEILDIVQNEQPCYTNA
jgi:hypothetical protein